MPFGRRRNRIDRSLRERGVPPEPQVREREETATSGPWDVADVPDDGSPAYEVLMFGKASAISERFAIGTVTHLPEGGGAPVVERAVLAAPWQLVSLLPGWEPLAS